MCIAPIILKKKETTLGRNKYTVPVPCGKCPKCAQNKINSWSFRIEQEIYRGHLRKMKGNYYLFPTSNPLFVTLTYDNDHLPLSESGKPTLCKRHVQLFLKKLRFHYAKHSKKSIRYYCVGEYGTRFGRPHYHIIILNLDLPELIPTCWEHGFTDVGTLDAGGISYVLKYVSKPKRPKLCDTLQEFSLCSKGLGLSYLSPSIVDYHHSDVSHCFVVSDRGYKLPIPKYYKEKLYPSLSSESPFIGSVVNPISRLTISSYLQDRSDNSSRLLLSLIRKLNPTLTELQAENLLSYKKLLLSHPKRLSEVF